jgi:hypothetical protein
VVHRVVLGETGTATADGLVMRSAPWFEPPGIEKPPVRQRVAGVALGSFLMRRKPAGEREQFVKKLSGLPTGRVPWRGCNRDQVVPG